MLKAIETHYNGYRFRSRLEARWAAFFDTLGVRYEYEPEGFDLDGLWYLPDFWLPMERIWVEIKPANSPTPIEIERLSQSSYQSWIESLEIDAEMHQADHVLLAGSPGLDGEYEARWLHNGRIYQRGNLFICLVCGHVLGTKGVPCWNCTWDNTYGYHCNWCDIEERGGKGVIAQTRWQKWFLKGDIYPSINPFRNPRLLNAYAAARSARFK